jgi:hypothetical protein
VLALLRRRAAEDIRDDTDHASAQRN